MSKRDVMRGAHDLGDDRNLLQYPVRRIELAAKAEFLDAIRRGKRAVRTRRTMPKAVTSNGTRGPGRHYCTPTYCSRFYTTTRVTCGSTRNRMLWVAQDTTVFAHSDRSIFMYYYALRTSIRVAQSAPIWLLRHIRMIGRHVLSKKLPQSPVILRRSSEQQCPSRSVVLHWQCRIGAVIEQELDDGKLLRVAALLELRGNFEYRSIGLRASMHRRAASKEQSAHSHLWGLSCTVQSSAALSIAKIDLDAAVQEEQYDVSVARLCSYVQCREATWIDGECRRDASC